MASTAMRPFLFTDESTSLRSFPNHCLSPSPPSLRASSLKLKSTFAFSSILRGRTAHNFPQPTLNSLIQADLQEADSDPHILLPAPQPSAMPRMNSTTTAVQEQPALQRPRSKSRTIIRMISTKFTRVTQSPPPLVKLPPPAPTGWSKDQRDAALRERGLLPPLRPNKDLSLQESEQDLLIPVVEHADESRDQEAAPSAADLIKKEWEAKNHIVEVEQRQRLNNFKFGGSASPVIPSPSHEKPLPKSSPDQVSCPTADRPTPPPNDPLPPVPALSSESVSQNNTPQSSSTNALPVSSSQAENKIRPLPSPPLPKPASSETEPWTVPLPPSPAPSMPELSSSPSPTSQIPPQSPSLRCIANTPQSVESSVCGSGANTPRPLNHSKTSSRTLPTTPVISLTPATEIVSPPSEGQTKSSAPDDSLSSAFHVRSDSFAQLEDSISSIATPSLDSTSNTTANSTTGASDAAFHISNGAKGPGKLGLLQVKTIQEMASAVPVIIESPVEVSRFSEDLAVVAEESSAAEFGVIHKKSENPAVATSPPPPPKSPPAQASLGTSLQPQRRSVTDPATAMDRRKSLNPFKRGQTIDVPAPAEPQRRLSVARSLSNLRRSFVGTLASKPKGVEDAIPEKTFDASHLPPSPTIPRAFSPNRPRVSDVSSAASPPPTPNTTARTRRAVSPPIYNRGSILLETAGIEDEETRRMTELAFLG